MRNKFALFRESHEPQSINRNEEGPADGNQTEYEQSGGEDESVISENELEDVKVPVRRKKSKYRSCDSTVVRSILSVEMKFDNAKLFK